MGDCAAEILIKRRFNCFLVKYFVRRIDYTDKELLQYCPKLKTEGSELFTIFNN